MAVHNAGIAAVFDEIGDLLELQNANPFRIRAYRNAARVVGELRFDIAARLAEGRELPKLPGIGEDLGVKMREIAVRGTCALLERLRSKLPPGITELRRIPGLGPRRVQALHAELGIGTLAELQRAARDGKLRALPGFGEKTERRVLEAVSAHLSKSRRFKLAIAAQHAEPYAGYLRKSPGTAAEVCVAAVRRRSGRRRGSVVFDARNGFFGGSPGIGIDPVRNADFGFRFRDRFAGLEFADFESLGVRLRLGQRLERTVFLAAVTILPVHPVRTLDKVHAAVFRRCCLANFLVHCFFGPAHLDPL